MPKYLTSPVKISLEGSTQSHLLLPLPPNSPRHNGKFVVEFHPTGDSHREIICWEPRRAKKMAPLEAAAVALQRLAEAARSSKTLDLKSVFQKYDTDGGGSIDKEELGSVLKEFQVLLSDQELSQVFAIFDPDGGGSISYLEFVYAIFNRRAFIKKLQLEQDKTQNKKNSGSDDGPNNTDQELSKHFVASNAEEEQSNEAYTYFKKTAARKKRAAANAAAALNIKKKTEQEKKQSLKVQPSLGHTYVASNKTQKNNRKPKRQRVQSKTYAPTPTLDTYKPIAYLNYPDSVAYTHLLIYNFLNRHKLKVKNLFKYADESSNTREDILSDFCGEIDVSEFITLVRHCEKEDAAEKRKRKNIRSRKTSGVALNSPLTDASIAQCFDEMAKDDDTIDVQELDEFIKSYRQKLGASKVMERTHRASIPLLQFGYHGLDQPHVSPRSFQNRKNTKNSPERIPKRPMNRGFNSSRATPPPTKGTYTVRQGRMTTNVTLSNSPRRNRTSVNVKKYKVGKTVHIPSHEKKNSEKTESEMLSVLQNWMDLHILRVKDAFNTMDDNRSGGLSPMQFMAVFTNLGCDSISRTQMIDLLKHVDADNSGDITLLELKRHIRRRRIIADKEGLSKLALRVVLEGGTSFPTVHFTDFEKYTSIECASTVLKKIETEEQKDPSVNLKTIFRSYDSDGGGSIDMEEFNQVLLELNIQLNPVELQDVFDIFDPDGGGEISYLELVYAVRHRTDFIRRLEKAEKTRKKEEELNNQKHWDDITKIKGRVEMNRDDMEEHAILWMRKTSEHTTG